jgi:hypothetical protein
LKYIGASISITIRVYIIEPMETRDMYLRADIDLANESGIIRHTVVTRHCTTLNVVIPCPTGPVISGLTPKLLQHITKSFVMII